jgi:hypothetical protein
VWCTLSDIQGGRSLHFAQTASEETPRIDEEASDMSLTADDLWESAMFYSKIQMSYS